MWEFAEIIISLVFGLSGFLLFFFPREVGVLCGVAAVFAGDRHSHPPRVDLFLHDNRHLL